MTKILTAKQKAEELGISLSGLAKSRHLYKHIKKSPRKYLYFEEEDRPFIPEAPVTVASSRSRRRNVPFGKTLYSKAPGGSGEKLKVLNQMRSKMALEGKIPKGEQEAFTEALAHTVKKNYKEIDEQRRSQLQQELIRSDEKARKRILAVRDPIEREPIRKYPYTMLTNSYPTPSSSSWRYEDKRSDERNKRGTWLDDIPTKYEYY